MKVSDIISHDELSFFKIHFLCKLKDLLFCYTSQKVKTDPDYGTVIVGGGTAGLAAGSVLNRNNSSYIILDKKEEIGLPVRSTGAVSLEWVRRIGMPEDPSIVASEIRNMSFRTTAGKRIDLNFDHPVGLVYDFTRYEKYLSEKFSGKLNIKMNTRILEATANSVKTDDETISSENVILASGPQSNLGTKLSKTEALVAYEETRSLDPRDDFQMILWFSDLAPGGYFWDFADSKNTRKIGVCYYPVNGKAPSKVLEEFTKMNPEVSGDIVHTMAHQIPLSKPADIVSRDGMYLTGDMINAVLNTTAGGLQGAFWSGKEAGNSVLSGGIPRYQQVWHAEIRPWLMKHHELHGKIHKKGEKSVGTYIRLAKLMPKSMQIKVFGGL